MANNEQIIAYKVVSKETRLGSNSVVFECNRKYDKRHMPTLKTVLKKHPDLQKYFPVYEPGAKVRAVKGSIGIMAFESESFAYGFIAREFNLDSKLFNIIRVKGPRKHMCRPAMVKAYCGAYPTRLTNDEVPMTESYPGCITFPWVKVLD